MLGPERRGEEGPHRSPDLPPSSLSLGNRVAGAWSIGLALLSTDQRSPRLGPAGSDRKYPGHFGPVAPSGPAGPLPRPPSEIPTGSVLR